MSREELADLYARIHACERCIEDPLSAMALDPDRVMRRPIAKALEAEVMLLGESLGGQTQRLTGVPYVRADGLMLQTGLKLDEFLRQFGYSIDPDSDRQYVYSTDAVERFPVAPNGKKRNPTPREVANCAEWFEAEVALIEPRILIVMGRPAARHFFPRYLKIKVNKLSDVCAHPYEATINRHQLTVYAIPHASPLAQGPARDEVYRRVGAEIREQLAATR